MVKKRLLLPYGVAGDTVIPLTLDELKWILRDVNVDAIDVSRYPNPDTFGYETAYKACNGTKKIYTDIKYNEYGLLYDLIPVCNNTIANRFNIRNIATIIDHKTLGFYRVINTEIHEEKSDTFGTPEYYDNMIIRRKVVGGNMTDNDNKVLEDDGPFERDGYWYSEIIFDDLVPTHNAIPAISRDGREGYRIVRKLGVAGDVGVVLPPLSPERL